jgi:hypothetical protein
MMSVGSCSLSGQVGRKKIGMKMNRVPVLLLLALIAIALSVPACGDDDDDDNDDSYPPGDDDDDNGDDDDDDAVDDDDDNDTDYPYALKVEHLLVPGASAPPNPETGAETPDDFNKLSIYRFRKDTGDNPPTEVKAILIMLPGYAAGASDFFTFARHLVTKTDGDIEVWAVDRRANLLEDQTGADAAESQKDPMLLWDYYFEGASIGGETFDGFIEGDAPITEMTSEWGLDLQLSDLRNLVAQVPEANREATVFIGGHSRGARYSQMYASYEFSDGHFGGDDLAGILLLDISGAVNPPTQNDYQDQLLAIRQGTEPRAGLLGNGGDTLGFLLEIQFFAMVASEGFGDPDDPEMGPDGFYPDWGMFETIFPLMTRYNDVTMTNLARFGLIFDNDTTIAGNNFYGHMGALTGGDLKKDPLGWYPYETGVTYTWQSYEDTEELMDIQNFLYLTYGGTSDFAEWYYPMRYAMDDHAAGDLETQGSWQHALFPFYTSRMESAVFAIEGYTAQKTTDYDDYLAMLPPVRGETRPRSDVGFDVIELPEWGHVEVLMVEPENNPFYDQFLAWIDEWSAGRVTVPSFGTEIP